MRVDVPICPLTGSSAPVMVNGQAVLPPETPQPTADAIALQVVSAFAKALFKAVAFVGKIVFFIFEFLLMCVIWRDPGSTGFRAGLCRSYEKAKLERKAKNGLHSNAGNLFGNGVRNQVVGGTSEALCARAEMMTIHHVIDGPDGLKLKLTLFPESKTVKRRIAVPYKNAKKRLSHSHTPVGDIAATAFDETFLFCVQNVVLICNRDIANGLFNQSKAVQSIPQIHIGTEKETAPSLAPTQVPLALVPVQKPGDSKGAGDAISAPVKQAQGTVLHMGMVTKQFGESPSYQTYEVVVRRDNGDDISFVGQQLQEKAIAGVFKVGDRVEIIQGKVQLQKTNEKGKTFKNTSNVFTVKVLQSAN